LDCYEIDQKTVPNRTGPVGGDRNGCKLNGEIVSAEGWSVAQIEARTKKLVDQAMALFSLAG